MLKRLLTQKRYFKNIYKAQKGITGLETAIILIAFVVVAAVFAYTVLSAGLFSTQKSQEAVYSGLAETQNTIDLKGAVVATGAAMLNNCDYNGWTAGGSVPTAITRETTNKWEGSASLAAVVDAGAHAGETLVAHAMSPMELTDGDTIAFWLKADAGLSADMTFALGTDINLNGHTTESYAINAGSSTNWKKYSFDLTGDNDDSATYYGIILTDEDGAGTFYLDNVMFEDVASQNGIPCVLDNCDYPNGWTVDEEADPMTRSTVDKVEGTAAMSVTIGADAALNDEIIIHEMVAKQFNNGDTISFWLKADSTLATALTFAIDNDSDFTNGTTQSYLIDTRTGDPLTPSTDWRKYTMTLSDSNDNTAIYYGIQLTTDAEGTFWIDDIEISNAGLNNNNDPMNSFATSVSFTVSLTNAGDGVDFTATDDDDFNGILSDEPAADKKHKVVIYYNDEYQQLTDLAWTKTAIGRDDGDDILDVGEKFQITVDLTYVNQNSGVWASSKIGANQTFTLEVKPPTGAVLTIERSMPSKVQGINNLN